MPKKPPLSKEIKRLRSRLIEDGVVVDVRQFNTLWISFKQRYPYHAHPKSADHEQNYKRLYFLAFFAEGDDYTIKELHAIKKISKDLALTGKQNMKDALMYVTGKSGAVKANLESLWEKYVELYAVEEEFESIQNFILTYQKLRAYHYEYENVFRDGSPFWDNERFYETGGESLVVRSHHQDGHTKAQVQETLLLRSSHMVLAGIDMEVLPVTYSYDLGIKMYNVYMSRIWKYFRWVVVLVHSSLAFADELSDVTNNAQSVDTLKYVELGCLVVYWMDIFLGVYALGGKMFFGLAKTDKFKRARRRLWSLHVTLRRANVLLVLVLTLDFVLFMTAGTPRFAKPVRPFLFLSYDKQLSTFLHTMINSMPSLLAIGMFFLLIILMYACLGIQLYGLPTPDSGLLMYVDPATGEPLDDNFNNIFNASLSMFVLSTAESYPAIMQEALVVSPWSVVYFISFMLITTFLILPILTATIFEAYSRSAANRIKHMREWQGQCFFGAFQAINEAESLGNVISPEDAGYHKYTLDAHERTAVRKTLQRTTLSNLPADAMGKVKKSAKRKSIQKSVEEDTQTITLASLFHLLARLRYLGVFNELPPSILSDQTVVDDDFVYATTHSDDRVDFDQFYKFFGAFVSAPAIGPLRAVSNLLWNCCCRRRKYYDEEYSEDVAAVEVPRDDTKFNSRLRSVVSAAIILNFIGLCFFHRYMNPDWLAALSVVDVMATIVFVVEVFLKVCRYGVREYWADDWNKFDLLITMISVASIAPIILDSANSFQGAGGVIAVRGLRAVGLLRLVRIMHLYKPFEPLSITFLSLWPLLLRLVMLLNVLMYAYSVVGGWMFSAKELAQNEVPPPFYFNELAWGMATMYQIYVQSNWNDLLYEAIRQQGVWGALFVLSFFVFAALILGNVLIAIIWEVFNIQHTNTSEGLTKAEKKEIIEQIKGEVEDTHHQDNVGAIAGWEEAMLEQRLDAFTSDVARVSSMELGGVTYRKILLEEGFGELNGFSKNIAAEIGHSIALFSNRQTDRITWDNKRVLESLWSLNRRSLELHRDLKQFRQMVGKLPLEPKKKKKKKLSKGGKKAQKAVLQSWVKPDVAAHSVNVAEDAPATMVPTAPPPGPHPHGAAHEDMTWDDATLDDGTRDDIDDGTREDVGDVTVDVDANLADEDLSGDSYGGTMEIPEDYSADDVYGGDDDDDDDDDDGDDSGDDDDDLVEDDDDDVEESIS